MAVVVDANDDAAVALYRPYGFVTLQAQRVGCSCRCAWSRSFWVSLPHAMKNKVFARLKIDALPAAQGWDTFDTNAVRFDVQQPDGTNADYVLCELHGRLLAVIEAKRYSVSSGETVAQAKANRTAAGVAEALRAASTQQKEGRDAPTASVGVRRSGQASQRGHGRGRAWGMAVQNPQECWLSGRLVSHDRPHVTRFSVRQENWCARAAGLRAR